MASDFDTRHIAVNRDIFVKNDSHFAVIVPAKDSFCYGNYKNSNGYGEQGFLVFEGHTSAEQILVPG